MKRALGGWLPLIALCAGIVVLALAPRLADAHATFDRSDPQPNSVLAESPAEIRIWFTEPLEFDESSVRLFDQGGNEVTNIESQKGDGDKSLVVPLAEPLTLAPIRLSGRTSRRRMVIRCRAISPLPSVRRPMWRRLPYRS